jgi:hypothetical protein
MDRRPNFERTPNLEERIATLFQPDSLAAPQFFDTLRRRSYPDPTHRLILAILEDAIHCFQDNLRARDPKRRALHLEAERWILSEDRTWIFSFENVCEMLGLEPGYLRSGLIRWKERQLASRAKSAR